MDRFHRPGASLSAAGLRLAKRSARHWVDPSRHQTGQRHDLPARRHLRRGQAARLWAGPQRRHDLASELTQDGMLTGTPAYMSPEQAAGEQNLDPRSDLYNVGTLGYFLLTGRTPFAGRSLARILAAQQYESPPSITEHRTDLPRDLEAVIMRCLAKSPADRFADAASLEQGWPRAMWENGLRATRMRGGKTRQMIKSMAARPQDEQFLALSSRCTVIPGRLAAGANPPTSA